MLLSYLDLGADQNPYPNRSRARCTPRDRITIALADGSVANVALKKVLFSGKALYIVKLTLT
jgi:hypothetical protein